MADKLCLWCLKPLPKYRRKYCSDDCSDEYFIYNIAPLWWNNAKIIALERAGNKCEQCGETANLEVHHIIPLPNSNKRHKHPLNERTNLKVLCRRCHNNVHSKSFQKAKLQLRLINAFEDS